MLNGTGYDAVTDSSSRTSEIELDGGESRLSSLEISFPESQAGELQADAGS